MFKRLFLTVFFGLVFCVAASAQGQVNTMCGTGLPGFAGWAPCPGGGSSLPGFVKTAPYQSAGTDQFGLAIGTNTQLTVPVGATCASFTVETAAIRRTSDGTSATTTNGTLISAGTQWTDCGPLAAYKFTAVSGSPTLDVEYFK